MSSKRAKTYSKRTRSFLDGASAPLSPSPISKKRSRDENESDEEKRVTKKPKTFKSSFESTKRPLAKSKLTDGTAAARKPLRQLVLAVSSAPALLSCDKCGLSYTRGAPEDEELHRSHCQRVVQGTEWGREEEREMIKSNATVVESHVTLPDGRWGRIVSIRASTTGRLGAKVCFNSHARLPF